MENKITHDLNESVREIMKEVTIMTNRGVRGPKWKYQDGRGVWQTGEMII